MVSALAQTALLSCPPPAKKTPCWTQCGLYSLLSADTTHELSVRTFLSILFKEIILYVKR